MVDPPQAPPPPPNAGDCASLLVVGEFVIKGIEGVLPEMHEHVIIFYNQLITMMNAAGPLWQLMTKERYNQIKGMLV
jgi:hypothetical protein